MIKDSGIHAVSCGACSPRLRVMLLLLGLISPCWPPNSPVDYSIWGVPSLMHSRRWAPARSPANLLGTDWSRRYLSRNRTVSQTVVARCCNRWRTHWATLWL